MYSQIYIIYNPISTSGHAQQKAERLAERLQRRNVKKVNVLRSEYPGHAEALAYQAAKNSQNALIVSVSGDGGYNEVVNGVVRARQQNPNCQPTCAILPAGNANDHRRSVRKRPLTWAITHTEPETMDLLKLTVTQDDYKQVRYAHSYIGVGVTSHLAAELQNETLGTFSEIVYCAKSVLNFHPVAVQNQDGKIRRYDSLIFANIHHMAKYMRLGNKADINNGSFRVAAVPYRSQFWLFRFTLNFLLFVFGLKRLPQQTSYEFSVPRTETIHLDGELMQLPKDASVLVEIAPAALPVVR